MEKKQNFAIANDVILCYLLYKKTTIDNETEAAI